MTDGSVAENARISVCGMRVPPNIHAEAARELGIDVCTGSPAEDGGAVSAGKWQETPLGATLRGRTLGIIGLGGIGSIVSRVTSALGMRVLACSPRLDEARARTVGVHRIELTDLLRQSDFVSLHVRLDDGTRGLFGERQIALMPKGACLINTARAELVDEQALRGALRDGKLAEAGLDVFWEEPLPADHWARFEPRVVTQPHVGGSPTRDSSNCSRRSSRMCSPGFIVAPMRVH